VPYLGSNTTAEFGQGVNHVVNNQHANLGSISLGDEASSADQGFDATSDHWNDQVGQVATTAKSVLAPYAFSRNASPNGTASQNFIPGFGVTGTGNGESQGTFGSNLKLRMARDNTAETE
jgi:hypothetical protein